MSKNRVANPCAKGIMYQPFTYREARLRAEEHNHIIQQAQKTASTRDKF